MQKMGSVGVQGPMRIDSGGILRALNKKKKAQCVPMAGVGPVIDPASVGVEPDYDEPVENIVVRGIGGAAPAQKISR